MNQDKIVKLAATLFVLSVTVPTVVNVTYNAGVAVVNGVNKAKFKRQIKKGLKDGSIVEIDGQYYKTVDEA